MSPTIGFQESLRPVLPTVLGCKDYEEEKQLLERVDRVLKVSGVEGMFLGLSRLNFESRAREAKEAEERVQVGGEALDRYLRKSLQALRCTVLKALVGGGYREMSTRLAHSPMYRWFCGCEDFEVIRVPGKSTLAEYAHWLSAEEMEDVLSTLTRAVSDENAARIIGLENELDMMAAWVDTTCLEANVHFPTDWILLRDGIRTLIGSIQTIRRHGLKKRMPEPGSFLSEINAQAMGMSATGRKPGSKKARKKILRRMKKICQIVETHGRRYRETLDKEWDQTDLTRKEAEVILRRMDNVLAQLPAARRQAHERIIGERQVSSAEKILSLYEPDIHVVVRGKAGAQVEFGNSLFIAETGAGFIFDHELRQGVAPGDAKWLQERYAIMQKKTGGQLCGVTADRGFDSKANRKSLAALEHFNGLCPRDPAQLELRHAKDEVFSIAQRRRAQTESRVGIFKNVFLDGLPRAKTFAHRELQVAWAVLAHNLWVLVRQPWVEERIDQAQAA